ncbi:MAG: hypothetical protein CUN55_03160 [Phototrophicales bacterium]|nr:MAG: hypothetical protein CUN55_03160 [Phototrophicales bacterium]
MSSAPQISSSFENPHLTHTFDPTQHVVGVRFEKLGKLYHFDYQAYPTIRPGDFVLVETVRGLQIGEVIGFLERDNDVREYRSLLRLATPRDLLLRQQIQQKEVEALITCREAASKMRHLQNVKFVKAEYTFDRKTCTISYATEDDVNLNGLRNALRHKIEGNIEFRQVGPRDVARILGGQGACGGPRCCSTFLTEFSPISIKMAKMQGIPLNPTEITGMCGRLRCCLIYEYEQYVEARKQLPRRGKMVGTPYGEGRVTDVYPLRDAVTVEVDDQRYLVEREDIIPLEEFRKLQEKAQAGCSKNESGGCDCGARRPKSPSQDLNTALELAHAQTVDRTIDGETKTKKGSTSTPRKRKRSRRGDKKSDEKKRRSKKRTKGEQKATPKAQSQDVSSAQRKPKRSKRRRGRGSSERSQPNSPKGEQ